MVCADDDACRRDLATLVLEKFNNLTSINIQHEARIAELERELRKAKFNTGGSQGGATTPRSSWTGGFGEEPSEKSRVKLEVRKLHERLKDCGIEIPLNAEGRKKNQDRFASDGTLSSKFSSRPRSKTCEDLQREILSGTSRIVFEEGTATRYTDILQVNVVAVLQGEEHCLIERERFDIQGGGRRNLKLPLRKKLRNPDKWRAEMRLALLDLLDLSEGWQEEFLVTDEGSLKVYEADPTSCDLGAEYPGLPTTSMMHEVTVKLPEMDSIEDQETLSSLGLPLGHDFVTSDVTIDERVRIHVWCWKSCKEEQQLALGNFQQYLDRHGIAVNQFGNGTMKPLETLYREVVINKESVLVERIGSNPSIFRDLTLLQIRVVAEVYRQRRVLTSCEQFLDDGRRRKVRQLVIHKLRDGDNWAQAVPVAFQERLGVPRHVFDECFLLDEDSLYVEESMRWSNGYPIETKYTMYCVTVTVRDISHPGLSELGLPRGNSFVSKDGPIGNEKRGRLHVWTWALDEASADEEDIDKEEAGGFGGSTIENICRQLQEASALVSQTVKHAHGSELPLERALAKISGCQSKLVRLDTENSDFDAKRFFGKSKHLGGQSAGVLADFISSNFTRGARLGGSRSGTAVAKHRHMSVDLSAAELAAAQRPISDGMPEALKAIRRGIEDFGLDILAIAHSNPTASVLGLYGDVALAPLCASVLKCGPDVCPRFLQRIASFYFDNAYHNSLHAAQVCHAGTWLSNAVGLSEHQRALERAAFIIAALCHDVKHFGRNNAFCVSSQNTLALLYNDYKVLENMHAATCFEALNDPEAGGMLQKVRAQDKAPLRSMIIELILSTDMAEHFDAISKSRLLRESADFGTESESHRRFLAQLCLKAGDICHSALPWENHTRWSLRVTQEFYSQGDEESRLGLPVSALCDRAGAGDWGKSQRGFIEFVCLPLFEELESFWELQEKKRRDMRWEASQDEDDDDGLGSTSSRAQSPPVSPTMTERHNPLGQHVVSTLHSNAARWTEDEETVSLLVQRLGQPIDTSQSFSGLPSDVWDL